MSHPRGFFKVPLGFNGLKRIVWATGHEYIKTGNNPWRTETVYLSQGILYNGYEADDGLTDRATKEEAEDWLRSLSLARDVRKVALQGECTARCNALDDQVRRYADLFNQEYR